MAPKRTVTWDLSVLQEENLQGLSRTEHRTQVCMVYTLSQVLDELALLYLRCPISFSSLQPFQTLKMNTNLEFGYRTSARFRFQLRQTDMLLERVILLPSTDSTITLVPCQLPT